MAESKQEKIAIKGNEGAVKSGVLNITVLSSGERAANAGKVLAICWVLAGVTVFIPIAHFFLVPAFAIAGPVMAVMKYNTAELVENAEGECPECGDTVEIDLDPADKLPKWTYCPACNKSLQLVYHSGSTES